VASLAQLRRVLCGRYVGDGCVAWPVNWGCRVRERAGEKMPFGTSLVALRLCAGRREGAEGRIFRLFVPCRFKQLDGFTATFGGSQQRRLAVSIIPRLGVGALVEKHLDDGIISISTAHNSGARP
jgi:hypothetical protein